MIHNTTEGFAIDSPLAKAWVKRMLGKMIIMGLIAGVQTIFGTWIGGFVYSPIAAIIFSVNRSRCNIPSCIFNIPGNVKGGG